VPSSGRPASTGPARPGGLEPEPQPGG